MKQDLSPKTIFPPLFKGVVPMLRDRGILGVALFLIVCTPAYPQDLPIQSGRNGDEPYKIEWVSQFPEVREVKDNKKGGRKLVNIILGPETNTRKSRKENWFTNLIFGRKPADLVKPMAITALNKDTVWVADQGQGSILSIFEGVGEMTRFRSREYESLPSIVDCCRIPGNKILFTDSKLNKVFEMTPGERELGVFQTSDSLIQPTGIAYSESRKELWIAETRLHRISVFDMDGKLLRRIGSRGYGHSEFNFPTFIWIDEEGIAYVVDAMNFRVQIFNPDGEFISMFGKPGDASGYLSRPKGIALDSFGHIYLADAMFHVVQVFDKEGKLLYILGSQGTGKGQFWMPTGIYIDNDNYIYVADSYNRRIQIFRLVKVK